MEKRDELFSKMCSRIGASDEASWQTSWLTYFGPVRASTQCKKPREAKKNTAGSKIIAKKEKKNTARAQKTVRRC